MPRTAKRKAEDPPDSSAVAAVAHKSPPKKIKRAVKEASAPSASQQRAAIKQLITLTQGQLDEASAKELLKSRSWNVERAADAYYSGYTASAKTNPTRSTVSKIFDRYRDDAQNAPDEINAEGTASLLGELDIELSDIAALIFSEVVSSPSLGVIHRKEFIDGWSDLGADTLPKMRGVIAQRRNELAQDPDSFRNVYYHTFDLALQEKQKALPVEIAVEFWKVLFSEPGFVWRTPNTPWLDWWLDFYESRIKKAVNKDLWKQTLKFARDAVRDDALSFWSEDSSWPSVIDEFVEWVRTEKRPDGDSAMEVE